MTIRISIAALALMLAACGDEPAAVAPGDDERTAEGEVLGGTISDDMLPLDSLRSQSPTVKPSPAATSTGEAESSSESEEAVAETTAEATPPEEPAGETSAETE